MTIKPLKFIAFALGLGLLLSACGQRGPLYMPTPPAPMAKPAGYDQPQQTPKKP